ncbi:META domain-containing protein [Microbacterium kunmingense]|uniref:META domain-containing protein n=1 Tax=Microbacterium kunmingense TaxID=2915939 RepID=UPI0020053684|nr:META domain-containing protein [Microbacterium kunmingense]
MRFAGYQQPAALPPRGAVQQRRGLEVSLWLSVPVILALVHFLQIFELFGTVGCEGVCDLDLIFAARAAYPWEVAVSLAVAAGAAIALRLLGKPTFWAGLIAVVLVVASATVTSVLVQSGLAPMYERNDRIAQGDLPAAPPPLSPVGQWGTDADEAPRLEFLPDGTLVGTDGCNDLSGEWIQDPEGEITLTLLSVTTADCDGIDTWLSKGRSARILGNFLYINGPTGSPIGGLAPTAATGQS